MINISATTSSRDSLVIFRNLAAYSFPVFFSFTFFTTPNFPLYKKTNMLSSSIKIIRKFKDIIEGNEKARIKLFLKSKTTLHGLRAFGTLLYRLCTTVTWNVLISRFLEECIHNGQDDELFFFVFDLVMVLKNQTPGVFTDLNSRNWASLNNRDEV